MKRRPLLGLLLLAFYVAASCSAGRQAADAARGDRAAQIMILSVRLRRECGYESGYKAKRASEDARFRQII